MKFLIAMKNLFFFNEEKINEISKEIKQYETRDEKDLIKIISYLYSRKLEINNAREIAKNFFYPLILLIPSSIIPIAVVFNTSVISTINNVFSISDKTKLTKGNIVDSLDISTDIIFFFVKMLFFVLLIVLFLFSSKLVWDAYKIDKLNVKINALKILLKEKKIEYEYLLKD